MESKIKLYTDFASLKNSIGVLQKSGKNPHFKNTYVELNTALQVTNEKLAENNFITFNQLPCYHDGKNFLKIEFIHNTGEIISSELELITTRQDPQMLGSSLTYMRRYSLITMLGLQTVDDDGNSGAGITKKITSKQREEIESYLEKLDMDKPEFCTKFKVNSLAEIDATKFTGIIKRFKEIEEEKKCTQ